MLLIFNGTVMMFAEAFNTLMDIEMRWHQTSEYMKPIVLYILKPLDPTAQAPPRLLYDSLCVQLGTLD